MLLNNGQTRNSIGAIIASLVVSATLSTTGCQDDPGSLGLGGDFVDSRTTLSLIDTFSVRLSTVILDSVVTSGMGNALVGTYRDNTFGKVSSNTYFQIGIPDNPDVQEHDVYQSLNLLLQHNGYYHGDTTKALRFFVHRLTEKIDPGNDGAITSRETFQYQSVPLGSLTFNPSPNDPADTVAIKLDDSVGLDLFTKLKAGSELLSNNESFTDYFRGLVLISDTTYEGSIIGLSTAKENLRVALYTVRGTTQETITWEFRLEDSDRQFNNIEHDLTSTELELLSVQRNNLLSDVTGGLAFLQGGIGLSVRVDFPFLQETLLLEKSIIMAARLSVSPLRNSYNSFELPPRLLIHQTDGLNSLLDAVASSSLAIDELYNEETTYSFDITGYLINELADLYVDPEKGLLITLSATDQNSRFYRAIIDEKSKFTKLKIYYLNY